MQTKTLPLTGGIAPTNLRKQNAFTPFTFQTITSFCRVLKKGLLLAFCAFCLSPFIAVAQGFKVSGNRLLDANGNNFIMKGFNVPTAWFVNDVNSNITNMKNRTGANCLRIVVSTTSSDASWQTTVANCIANRIVPMVELHSATGNNSPSTLNQMAQFWASKASYLTRSDIARYILINIANEWGDWYMSANATGTPSRVTWRDAYRTAITTIRNAGIRTTLVVDAPGYGQDNKTQTLLAYADDLQAHDPQHNLLFSLHLYCEWRVGGSSPISLLPGVKNAGIPVIVGEFGFQHASDGSCDINEAQVISTANSNGIGWLAWSWKGNGPSVGYLDMSNDWAGTSLTGWGNTIVNGSGGTKTAATASVFSTTPPPSTGAIANGTYRITARHSGKSLDVLNSSTADGANVAQWTYSGGNNQQWFVQSLGSGVYSIRNVNSNKSLDVSGSSTADGADINQWTYGGGNNQRWRIESVGSGYYRIVNVNSSKCVDVVSASTADGAAINQWTCSGQTNQSFSFQQLNTAVSARAPGLQMEEEFYAADASVYPNPSAASFTFYQKGVFTYRVMDFVGRTIEKGQGRDQLSFGKNFVKGNYVLQVTTLDKTSMFKLVKN
ncbi:MAG TPA: RICIN domain-containing protein [Flavisolibacter sp.]|jgi:mannan endo-1,4-beta-mannosidase